MNLRLLPVALLAAVMLAAPASALAGPVRAPLGPQVVDGPTLHPSGRDRYVEAGGSQTQGKAASDPDGDYNYGIDQYPVVGDEVPGGGLYTIDQDGNNGCGNDQDFEDDNNGRCGGAAVRCTDASSFQTPRTHRRHVVTCPTDTPAETDSATETDSSTDTSSETSTDWSFATPFG